MVSFAYSSFSRPEGIQARFNWPPLPPQPGPGRWHATRRSRTAEHKCQLTPADGSERRGGRGRRCATRDSSRIGLGRRHAGPRATRGRPSVREAETVVSARAACQGHACAGVASCRGGRREALRARCSACVVLARKQKHHTDRTATVEHDYQALCRGLTYGARHRRAVLKGVCFSQRRACVCRAEHSSPAGSV